MEQFTMKTAVGTIHCCQWLPEAEPIGVVQIIHGVAEYAARYNGFASFLAAHGFVVVGEDHPGHGQSVEPGNSLGYLQGGWKGTVQLVHQLYTRMKNRYPGLPYFMLGHSMGSFLLRTYLYTYHADLAGAVLCGTNWLPKVMVMGGLLTCREEEHRLGERSTSPLIQKLMFGSFNEKFAPNRTPYDWVCSDPAVVDAYAADPLCTWKPTIQLCREMMNGIAANEDRENLSRMQKELPVFFVAGQLDPVGNMGNGVLRAVSAFKAAGMQEVLVELYPFMRHECLNEIGKEKVYRDVLQWIQDHLPPLASK